MPDLPYPSFRALSRPRVWLPAGVGVAAGVALASGGANMAKRYIPAGGRWISPLVGAGGGVGAAILTNELVKRLPAGRQVKHIGSLAAGVAGAAALGFGLIELLSGSNPIAGVGAAMRNLPRSVGAGSFMPSAIRFQQAGTGFGPLRTFQVQGPQLGPLAMGSRRKNLVVA